MLSVSYHATSYYIQLHYIILNHIISLHTISYHIMSYLIIYHIVSCHIMVYCIISYHIISCQMDLKGELGIFCPPLVPIFKPFTAPVRSSRLSVPSSSVDVDKGSQMASGVLCLVRMFVLHKLDRLTAWADSESHLEHSR